MAWDWSENFHGGGRDAWELSSEDLPLEDHEDASLSDFVFDDEPKRPKPIGLAKALERTRLRCARFTFPRTDKHLPLWTSKIGGAPYLPLTHSWPSCKTGRPMDFICQINLREVRIGAKCVPPNFPEEGILSFWIDAANLPVMESRSPAYSRVLYFPEVVKDPQLLQQEFPYHYRGYAHRSADGTLCQLDPCGASRCSYKPKFKPCEVTMPLNDYRYKDQVEAHRRPGDPWPCLEHQVSLTVDSFNSNSISSLISNVHLSGSASSGSFPDEAYEYIGWPNYVGGYPDDSSFRRDAYHKYTVLLLQVTCGHPGSLYYDDSDSDSECYLYWACTPDALAQRDFSEVLCYYTLDC